MNHPSPLEAIFFAALEKGSPQERAAYLDEACASDADLRRRVEKMLAAQAEAGSFLEQPAHSPVATTDRQPPSEVGGAVIGPYKLLEQIGEGGMGTVWMAQQTEPVKRLVAVKLIKAGMDSKQVIARFEAERQALALMDHPNIARVLDAGATSAGRPYFVMDLVKGVPITKYCDEHHLTPRQRLELFIPVCQAVQHAHQKGIIHRDIKPSNVLVALYDGQPAPKVIDFGVAKAAGQSLTDKTLVTGFGALVGTLEYMSPEQAEINQLDIDTRSDIYSLGVLLYELLTGSTPFTKQDLEQAGMLEMLRVIREQEPSKPSTKLSTAEGLPTLAANRGTEPAKLTKLVRGELDWIVMKALEKDRGRRYETANGFAVDVQRYLNDEQVAACPPSASYRFRKFARRNKQALVVAAMLTVAVLVVAGTLGWGVRDREAHAQDAARERAARQAAVEQEVNLALKEAEQWQEQAKWPEALLSAKRAEGLLAGSGSDELRARLHLLRKDLEIVLRLDDIRLLSSQTTGDSFDYETANRAYAKAFADYGIDIARLPAEEAAARMRARAGVAAALVSALDDWAHARSKKDRTGGAALLTVAQAADQDRWRRQVREALRQKNSEKLAALAATPQLLRQPPTSLMVLARALRAHGKLDKEIDFLRQAQRQHPGDFWINYHLCVALQDLGPPYRDEAVSFGRAALAARPHSQAAQNTLGVALYAQKNLGEAIIAYHRAIELDPRDSDAYSNLALALVKLADAEKLPEALAAAGRAIELDPKNARAHNVRGLILSDQEKLDDAAAAYRKAIELDPKTCHAHTNLGINLGRQGKLDQAIACCHNALEIDAKDISAYDTLGVCLDKQGKLEEAIDCYRKGLEIDRHDVSVRNKLGEALMKKGWNLSSHPDSKLRDVKRALEASKEAVELAPQSVLAWQYSGWIEYRAANWKASIDALEKSSKLQKGGDCCQWIVMSLAHGKLATEKELAEKERAQHKAEARRWYDQAVKQINTWGPGGNSVVQDTRAFRAEAEELLGVKQELTRLEMLVAAQPDAWEPRINLAQAYANDGLREKAAAEYTKATEVKPDAWEPWSRRSFFHLSGKQWERAASDFSKAIDLAPQVHTNWFHRGHAYLQLAQWDKAAADFTKVVEGWPDEPEGWYLRALACAQLNEPDKALADLRQAVGKGFKNIERMKFDRQLDPLRSDEAFQNLLTELEAEKD